ncbi:hypothetical protein ACCQ08_00475 [Comamonas sp. SY3]|uniref:huwentoxin-IV family protein n=1 Tax=Comamonas sp. SY3 TaxID=3243601 RepID=UPI0035938080
MCHRPCRSPSRLALSGCQRSRRCCPGSACKPEPGDPLAARRWCRWCQTAHPHCPGSCS